MRWACLAEDGTDLPLRLIDDFVMYHGGSMSLLPVEALDLPGHGDGVVQCEGRLLAPLDSDSDCPHGEVPPRATMRIRLMAVTEWCIDYSPSPTLWIITPFAWSAPPPSADPTPSILASPTSSLRFEHSTL